MGKNGLYLALSGKVFSTEQVVAVTQSHIFGINITGVSVNPARSFGPALIVGGKAMAQVWLFLAVPSVAGIAAGLLFKFKALEK